MTREVSFINEVRALRTDKKKLSALISLLDAHYAAKNRGTLSIVFVTHEHLTSLHAEFFNDATPTDIITFEGVEDEEGRTFGELCISPQAAREYVKKHGGKFEEELKRYVIHGYLHLVGYDDLKPKNKRKMRAEEKKCLLLAKGIKGIFTPAS